MFDTKMIHNYCGVPLGFIFTALKCMYIDLRLFALSVMKSIVVGFVAAIFL